MGGAAVEAARRLSPKTFRLNITMPLGKRFRRCLPAAMAPPLRIDPFWALDRC